MNKILAILFLFPILAQADLSEYKRTCKDIGYKPKTEDFGSCVLKLKKSMSKEQMPTEQILTEQIQQVIILNMKN